MTIALHHHQHHQQLPDRFHDFSFDFERGRGQQNFQPHLALHFAALHFETFGPSESCCNAKVCEAFFYAPLPLCTKRVSTLCTQAKSIIINIVVVVVVVAVVRAYADKPFTFHLLCVLDLLFVCVSASLSVAMYVCLSVSFFVCLFLILSLC